MCARKYITTENAGNLLLFILAISTLCSYAYYNFTAVLYGKTEASMYPYYVIFAVVRFHIYIDIFLTNTLDFQLHHIFAIGNFFYNMYYNVNPEYGFAIVYPLLNTEISSIFYVLRFWLPKTSALYNINKLLFYLAFVKFRIYDFYYKILYDHSSSFNILIQQYSPSNFYMTSILLVSCYGLFLINLYWFALMNIILYKSLTKPKPVSIFTPIQQV
jgi:hypothetical protein